MKTSHVQLDSESVTKIALVDGDLTTGAYVVVAVSDNGVGMDSATLDRVFDPFFTTKPGGSGLGLAAVLGIMRGHSGGIGLHTVKGEGTRFTLYFPASHKAIAGNLMSAESSPTATTSISKNCNILVIDDEPTVLELAADVLEMAGMHSVTIDEPLAGIRYFEIHSDKIDLVMLDLSMPKMSGLEVFEALQALDPTVRVLLTSGYSREDVIGRFSENRVAGFIQKPYNVDQLINSVHKALNRELA